MKRRPEGFSLVELMISLAIIMGVLTVAITFFTAVGRNYKVQTKIIETNVEGILGLEILRRDLESLGYGLPWNGLVAYSEATSGRLNDSSTGAPRAVVSIDNASFTVNHSDYLVIKSARVGMAAAAGKWTTLRNPNVKRVWVGGGDENLADSDRVIVLAPGSSSADGRTLVTPGGAFFTTYAATSGFAPFDAYSTNLIYGIDNQGLRFPFNRADYYIDNTAGTVPAHCAPNTGVLVKRVVRHSDGALDNALPLLDCAADLQVVYGLDTNADGVVDNWTDDISTGLTAEDIRNQLVEVRVHILAQEGQRDDSYTLTTSPFYVGSQGMGRNFDLSAYTVPGGPHYRWKLYTIVVKPRNLAK